MAACTGAPPRGGARHARHGGEDPHVGVGQIVVLDRRDLHQNKNDTGGVIMLRVAGGRLRVQCDSDAAPRATHAPLPPPPPSAQRHPRSVASRSAQQGLGRTLKLLGSRKAVKRQQKGGERQ